VHGVSYFVVAGIVAAAIGCERSQEDETSCIDQSDECAENGSVLRVCVDGSLTDQLCEDLCRESDPNTFSFGCLHRPDADDRCNCTAAEPPPVCSLAEPPPPTCNGPRSLRHCLDGDQVATECNEICSASSPELHDVGCFYDPDQDEDACVCAREGDACDPVGYDGCVDDELLHCEAGVWRLTDCLEWCSPEVTRGCVFDELDIGRCACGDTEGTDSATTDSATGG
jgi:hypothetical protein